MQKSYSEPYQVAKTKRFAKIVSEIAPSKMFGKVLNTTPNTFAGNL